VKAPLAAPVAVAGKHRLVLPSQFQALALEAQLFELLAGQVQLLR
jgi:hypothetical protein